MLGSRRTVSTGVKVFGIIGWKNSGKTTLLTRLVRHLTAEGLRVSTVKHAHHGFDIDVPGKDTYLHREAGAVEVLVGSDDRWALMHERRQGENVDLAVLLAKLESVDLVLVEGYKRHPHPKLHVVRPAAEFEPISPSDETIVAYATDDPEMLRGLTAGRPVFAVDDVVSIASFVIGRAEPHYEPA